MFVALGRSREEREIARAQRSSRIVRPGPLDLYASNQEERKKTNRTGPPFALFCPARVRETLALCSSRSSTLPSAPSLLDHPTRPCRIRALALWPPFPPPPASRGGDVIHACDATTWIVLLHSGAGVELYVGYGRAASCTFVAITCPPAPKKSPGLADGSWGLGIVDSESRKTV